MKKYILFIACFMALSATAQNCEIVNANITNGVRTNFSSSSASLDASFLGLDIEEAHTCSKSLWLGGFDSGGNLKLAANTYVTLNQTDFYAGAIDNITGLEILDHCSDSKKMWQFKDVDITLLKTKFAQGTLVASDLTEDLLSYPGRLNPWYVQFMGYHLDQDLAPFIDQNGDGSYNPLDGDYPITLEENPDFVPAEFSFTVYNDLEVHTTTQGAPIGAEVHQTSYLCHEAGNDLLNHTVFQRLKIINKSTINFSDFKIGIYIDDVLGASLRDDYMGCDTTLATVYSYNAYNGVDEDDGSSAVKLHFWLNKDLETSMPIYPPGIGVDDNMYPSFYTSYFSFLNANWSDGIPLTRGGTGRDPSSIDTVHFAFPDPPSDANGWSLSVVSPLAAYSDMRNVTTFSEPLFETGEAIIIDLADVALVDSTTTGFEKIDDLTNIVAQIKDKYNDVATSSTSDVVKHTETLILSPNPATSFIKHALPRNQPYTFDIYDVAGRLMDRQTLRAHDTEISLSKLSQGVFMIRTRDKQGEVHVGKIVKI